MNSNRNQNQPAKKKLPNQQIPKENQHIEFQIAFKINQQKKTTKSTNPKPNSNHNGKHIEGKRESATQRPKREKREICCRGAMESPILVEDTRGVPIDEGEKTLKRRGFSLKRNSFVFIK